MGFIDIIKEKAKQDLKTIVLQKQKTRELMKLQRQFFVKKQQN